MTTIFFARYSILQCLLLFPEIRNARLVQYQPVIRSRDRQHRYVIKIVQLMVQFINPDCKQKEFQREEFIVEEWLANRDSINILQRYTGEYLKSGPCQFLQRVIGSCKVVKYFQGTLTFVLPAWLAFEKVSNNIEKERDTICMHAWEITAAMRQNLGLLRCCLLKTAYYVQHTFLYFAYLLTVSLMPVLYLFIRSVRGFRFREFIIDKQYFLAMPVLWGVSSDGKNVHNGVLKQIDDGYLYGEELQPGNILHIFGKWNFKKSDELKYQNSMEKLGYEFVYSNSFKLNPKFVLLIFKTQITIMLAFLSAVIGFRCNRQNVIMSRFLNKAVYYCLEKHLELTNVKYKIDFVKDDYNPAHVINSVVARNYGVIPVGVQHTASPFDSPQLCFIDFDLYIVYGDFYVNMFNNCWRNVSLAKIGREVLDCTTELINSKDKLQKITNDFSKLFGKAKYRVLVLLSGPAHVNRGNMWEEFYLGMKRISKLNLDCQIILRLRETSHSKDFDFIKRIVELGDNDSRFITNQTEFSTQELMPICDLIITPNSSFGINEALAAGKRVFTFDLTGAAKLYFDGYGNDFVMESGDDLVNVFEGLESNFEGMDCDWDRLTKELNYYADGNNCSKMRDALSSVES